MEIWAGSCDWQLALLGVRPSPDETRAHKRAAWPRSEHVLWVGEAWAREQGERHGSPLPQRQGTRPTFCFHPAADTRGPCGVFFLFLLGTQGEKMTCARPKKHPANASLGF